LFHIQNRYISYSLYWVWALLVIFPVALLSYAIVEKPWIKLGDQWRRSIEKNYREKLASQKEVANQEEVVERPTVLDQEVARQQETVRL
jgi:peptidoglycan/LPS O-acetylase OafA/YrhL